MPIKLLPPQLANQIAAGEVVERPASVVKELVENSIDAGASEIEVIIERGGHKRITIRDNGCGIPKSELALALSRHATSKISTLDDLEAILSLGFRGEALASISAVSRLTLTSRPDDQDDAWQACCQGRDMQVMVQPAAHPKGTSIDVADLFYNTPARRKFLKAERTEFIHIEEVIKRLALSHPQLGFKLVHNDKVIKRLMPVQPHQSTSKRVADVIGHAFCEHALYSELQYEGISATGWFGDATQLRSATDQQFVFINQRAMRDKLLLHAIKSAYESVYGSHEQPSFVLMLTMAPRELDVNVHPAKHEVRFQQPRLVHDFVQHLVTQALRSSVAAPAAAPTPLSSHQYEVPPQLSSVPSARVQPSKQTVITRAYQSAWQSLNTVREFDKPPRSQAASSEVSPLVPLNKRYRLEVGDPMSMLDAQRLATAWALSIVKAAKHPQPLFVPVVIDVDEIDAMNVARLKDMHFAVTVTRGKCRVTEVPEGCRDFPWLHWLPRLLEGALADTDAFARIWQTLDWQGADPEWSLVWRWYDEQSQEVQQHLFRQHAVERPLNALLQWWFA